MRVGALTRLKKDTDIDKSFEDLCSMGMESCQLVCWDRER